MEFLCDTCNARFKFLQKYHFHQRRNLPGAIFKCRAPRCFRQFRIYKNFYMHIYRNHEKQDNLWQINCNIKGCNFLICSKKDLSSHISSHIKIGSSVSCPTESCKNSSVTFSNVSTWRSHIFRKHYDSNTLSATTNVRGNNNNNDRDVMITIDNADDTNNIEGISEVDDNDQSVKTWYTKSLSVLYLTLHSKYFVTEKAINTIIEHIRDINEISNNAIIEHIKNYYDVNINQTVVQGLNYFNDAHNTVSGLLRTTHTRHNYFKNEFEYVHPKCINFGICGDKLCNYYYVPIIETIKVLMKNKNIQQWLTEEMESSDNIFANITDGSVFKNNSFFSENPNALRIIIFQDAFEICNPLGSSRKKHKVVGVYMILANTKPFSWSKVDNMFLVALAYEKDINQFGFHSFLRELIKDLKELEDTGVQLNNNFLKGSLVAVLGDNLGSHQVGGFCENFSTSQYICRYCYITNDVLVKTFNNFQYRTKQSYQADLEFKLCLDEIHYKGVKHDSVLNSLKYFHVCSPGLPPCIAHDLFEGVVQYDLMLIINNFARNNVLTIDLLNEKLQNLHFCGYSLNIPKLKRNSNKLPGSAHENIIILQVLPFAVYDLVKDLNNPLWKMVILLREVCNIVLSIKLHIGQIAYLKYLVEEYLDMRVKLFPNIKLRPKHHYLLHYSKLITQFGPLKNLWTLRFESKHKYFKNIVKHSPNFKNILYSLAERHQFLQALHLNQKNCFSDNIIADKTKVYYEAEYPTLINDLIKVKCNFELPFFISKCIIYRGIHYKESMYICYDTSDTGDYLLLQIKYILINNEYSDCLFIGNNCEISYDVTVGLYYELSQNYNRELICINKSHLLCSEPLFVTKNGNDKLFYFKSEPYNTK